MFPIFLLGSWADRTCFFMVMTEALTEAQEGKRISSSHLHHVYLYPVDESKSCDQNHSQQVEKYTLCTEKPGHGCGYKGVKTWGKWQNLSHIAISGFKGTGKYNPPCVPRRMIENICWTPLKIFSGMSQSPYNGLKVWWNLASTSFLTSPLPLNLAHGIPAPHQASSYLRAFALTIHSARDTLLLDICMTLSLMSFGPLL